MPLSKEIQLAKRWIKNLSPSLLPKDDFQVSFSRSSGPGGQKVNKTSSKATVVLPQWHAKMWIPQEIKRQMVEHKYRYITKRGNIVIQNDTLRSRDQNEQLCYDKFCSELRRLVTFPGEVSEEDRQKWVQVRKRTNEQRLHDKKRRSMKKESKRFEF